MASQSASGDPAADSATGGGLATPAYPAAEWRLLTRLPARVVVAAISAEPDSPRRTVAEGLAGLEAIAAGRAFDSDLVRAVAAAIYAESGDDTPDDTPAAEEFTDREAGVAEVLAACQEATEVLAARADPADSAAYRQWVQSVAVRVCGASRTGGLLGVGGEQVSPAERAFLTDLAAALHLT